MMNQQEIDEILEDHKEMIETAINEGVTEDELVVKFGNPSLLAKELKFDSSIYLEPNFDSPRDKVIEKGFKIYKTFHLISAPYSVSVKLVSEDIKILNHDSESIEVYHKGDIEKYTCEFSNESFLLKKNKNMSLFNIRKSTEFVVYLPKDVKVTDFSFSITSGDATINGHKCNKTKVNSVSGNLLLQNFESGSASLQSVSGDMDISKAIFSSVAFQSVSGDAKLNDVISLEEMRIKTVSGDFELNSVKSGSGFVKSVSGDVKGFNFYPVTISLDSVSGDVHIENNDKQVEIKVGNCKSISGDIVINGAKY